MNTVWKHPKYKDGFTSAYETTKSGDRVFVLTQVTLKKRRKITYESHQSAKKNGWVKAV